MRTNVVDWSSALFSMTFLHKPLPGYTVDWDRIDSGTPLLDTDEQEYTDQEYMAGILVKDTRDGMVWRLTGEKRGDMFVGVWPD